METEYYITKDITNDDYKHFLLDILYYLKKKDKEWDEDKIFVGGEGDSNQTEFERKSNHCEIAVLANSKILGYALLFFLRMIIDEHFTLLLMIIFDEYEESFDIESIHISDIINNISNHETTYTNIFRKNEIPTTKLIGWENGKIVTKKYSKKYDGIDLWDFERIKTYIETSNIKLNKEFIWNYN